MANETGLTEVSATSMDIVGGIVQDVLKEKSILLPTINNYSSMVGKGVKSIALPRRNEFSAADKAENTDLTAQTLTFSTDVLNLDKHKAIYSKLEKIAELQATPSVEAEIIKEMAQELALQVDRDIISSLKGVSVAAPDHLLDYADTVNDKIARVDFGTARTLLRRQNVPMMDGRMFALISPEQEGNLLNIDGFVDADRYGSRESLLNGEIGRIFGFTILAHSELTAAETIMYHGSHAGIAFGMNPEFKTDDNLSAVAKEYLLHQNYGVKTLDRGVRGVFFNGTGA